MINTQYFVPLKAFSWLSINQSTRKKFSFYFLLYWPSTWNQNTKSARVINNLEMVLGDVYSRNMWKAIYISWSVYCCGRKWTRMTPLGQFCKFSIRLISPSDRSSLFPKMVHACFTPMGPDVGFLHYPGQINSFRELEDAWCVDSRKN